MSKRILIIMSGIPCSGKSYLTSILNENFSDDYTVLKIERDEIFGRIISNNPGIGNNKKNKMITEEMNKIYDKFNSSDKTILIVDSCSGGDAVKEFIMQKAIMKTKTIVFNFIPKMNDDKLDIRFYFMRAQERPPHFVFPKEEDKQIKELEKCYQQWTMSYICEKWSVIDLEFDWKIDEIIEKFKKMI
jgi:tRNA uridine 5-carbamoylmethylation protein Kti12